MGLLAAREPQIHENLKTSPKSWDLKKINLQKSHPSLKCQKNKKTKTKQE